ncbi:MAG: ribose ABC transporter permease, partial [Ruthenibacterium sp.]
MEKQLKRKKFNLSTYAIYLVMIALIIFFSIVADGFFSSTTFFNILRQVAVNGVVAVGMTMVIITGGIDISVGSLIGASSVGCAMMMSAMRLPPLVAVLLTLLFGLAVGL